MLNVQGITMNPFQENTYIVWNAAQEAIIVDPGCYTDAEQQFLQNFITEKALRPVLLVNTHCHLDHVFGNQWVHETYGLTLHIHPQEKVMLEHAPASGVKWGVPFEPYTGPVTYVNEGTQLKLGDNTLDILFVPGHSPGHICLYNAADSWLIAGDTLFKESIGRTDLPLGNHDTLLQSIRSQLFVLPNNTVVLPGHNEATTIGQEKKYNPFLQMP
jgi:glyoxylase-like metal-dependent hydrolase (beta-lactamase superfamily II)